MATTGEPDDYPAAVHALHSTVRVGARHRPPTIKDVAALSGVSKSTVSNVIRGTGSFSPETRARVLDAIRTLGYRPNAAARNLVQQRTNLIGVVVGELTNTFNAELVKRIEQRASSRQYTTLICNTEAEPERERSRIEALLEQRVDGIAMLEFSGDRAVLSQLLSERVPVVMVSSWTDYVDCIAVDDYAGIALLVDHLAGLGHTRIGYVIDPRMEPTTGRVRVDAFERALLRHGLQPRPDWRVTWRAHDGGDGVARQLLTGEDRPTAIVAANDDTAIEVMQLSESLGLAVPADLSITGFDDVPVAALSRIALTTVAQSAEDLAERGLEFLLERIARGYDEPIRHARLEPTLVVRASTGPPPPATPS